MIDQSFYVPRIPVAVVDCGATQEAALVRGLLESMNAVVTLHQPGTPKDFLLVLGQGESAPAYMVICGHGDENGFVFGGYGPQIDTTCLVKGSLPAAVLAASIRLPGRIVVSTACDTGAEAFSQAFLAGGVRAYIAPAGAPEGADAQLFVHHFFYNVFRRGLEPEEAWLRARSYDEEGAIFVLHRARPDHPHP